MLLKNQMMPVPARCSRQKSGRNTYIYLRTRYYRNAQGSATTERVSIGKLDEATGLLIPNKNYYEHFPNADLAAPTEPADEPILIKSAGTYAVFKSIASQLGLNTLLQECFGDMTSQLLAAAQYMVSSGSIMYYMEDWMEEHLTFAQTAMSSTKISKMFAGLSDTDKTAFFYKWIQCRAAKEYLAYDVSSVSTYSKNIQCAEWGYNRDKEALPQLNLAMFYGQESKLPLYYRVYPGSITDKSHLKYMTEDLLDLGLKRGYLLMDRGFYSEENLKYLIDKGYQFVIPMPSNLKLFQKLIDSHRNEIVLRSTCKLGEGLPYGKSYELNEYGFRMKAHIYYDDAKAHLEADSFYRRLKDLEEKCKTLTELPKKNTLLSKFFVFEKTEDKISFARNNAAIDAELTHCGFFVLIDTAFKEDTADVLDTYRRRDSIEKCFDDLKNEIDLHRLHVHSDTVADGKVFVAFLALIFRSYLVNKLSAYMNEKNFTFQKIIIELDKIKLRCSHRYSDGYRLLNPISKTQNDILTRLSLDDSIFSKLCMV